MKLLPVHIACISAGRPHNVPAVLALAAPYMVTFYVPPGDMDAYAASGATSLMPVPPTRTGAIGNLVAARNAALAVAFDGLERPCLQLDDDIRAIEHATYVGGDKRSRRVGLHTVIGLLYREACRTQAKMVGVAPTTNLLFWNPRPRRVKPTFVAAACALVMPTPLRFDPQFLVKEDYDYTCQHIRRYGTVARRNDLLLRVGYGVGPGGAVAYRTRAIEADAIERLKRKWGAMIRLNSRRDGEVLLVT